MSKRRFLPVAALLLALAAPAAFAQQAAPGSWEQLTPAQRELLTQPIRERWNNADAAQRQRMLAHAERWREMPPEQRARARRGYDRFEQMDPARREQMRVLFERTRGMDPQQRRHTFVLYHAMRGMAPAERQALVERWRGMNAEQREAWVREHAPAREGGPRRPH